MNRKPVPTISFSLGAQAACCYSALMEWPHINVMAAKDVPVPVLVGPDLTDLAEQVIQKYRNS